MPALGEAWRSGRAAWSSGCQERPGLRPGHLRGLGPTPCSSLLPWPTGPPVAAVFLIWWGAEGRSRPGGAAHRRRGRAGRLAMENAELARQTRLRLEETEGPARRAVRPARSLRTVTGQLHQEDVVESHPAPGRPAPRHPQHDPRRDRRGHGRPRSLLLLRDGARVLNPPPLSSAARKGLAVARREVRPLDPNR